MNNNITYITGLWDIGRSNISDNFKRDYNHYLNKFKELLESDVNLFIYCSNNDNDFIWKFRKPENTFIKNIELDELKKWFEFSDKVEKIRTNKKWYKFAGWLEESPQAKLEYYNIITLSKMFFINDVTIYNPFSSEYFFWIDAGLTNTVSSGYFTHDKVLDYIDKYYNVEDKFLFLKFPYDGNHEIHGFRKDKINEYSDSDNVSYVCRGGFFGGKKEHINVMSTRYYNVLSSSLSEGLMGTEESIFTILSYLYSDDVNCFELESNGLVYQFFEYLKNNKDNLKSKEKKSFNELKISIYVITYNSPSQFKSLCESILTADYKAYMASDKILLNNSIDRSTDTEYDALCEKYNFTQIKKNNIGICGGRQFIAEHFYNSEYDYMYFFEDDMFMKPPTHSNKFCVNGFRGYVSNIFEKTLKIIHNSNLDFLKLQFTELYGDNGTQWAWYNLPQEQRLKYFPENPNLPKFGIDNNAPKTKFKNIIRFDDITYADGEVYYCNWPHVIGKKGTKKIFIDNKFEHPFEQTWMSLVFNLQKNNEINSAVLLLSPINHDRFEFYSKEERKEN